MREKKMIKSYQIEKKKCEMVHLCLFKFKYCIIKEKEEEKWAKWKKMKIYKINFIAKLYT